jgi:virginiamycin B lyase
MKKVFFILLLAFFSMQAVANCDVDPQNKIYRRDGNKWTQTSGQFIKQISVGNRDSIWVITCYDKIYKWNGIGGWTQIPGSLASISVGSDGSVWGVNKYGNIFKWNGIGGWTQIPGGLASVSVGNSNNVWGVNRDGNIYKWSGSGWTLIPGGLASISVAGDGSVWGVNRDGNSYKWNGYGWTQVYGKILVNISVGSRDNVWGVDINGDIFKWDGSKWWTQFTGSLKQISVGFDGTIWAISAKNPTLMLPLGHDRVKGDVTMLSKNFRVWKDAKHHNAIVAINGGIYHQQDNGRRTAAYWKLVDAGDGYFYIQDHMLNLNLVAGDVYDGRIYYQNHYGRDNAKWYLLRAPGYRDGHFYIMDKKHNKALIAGDIYDGSVYHQAPSGRSNAVWYQPKEHSPLGSKMTFAGSSKFYTPAEFKSGLENNGFTLVKDGKVNPGECALVYSEANRNDLAAEFGVLACAVKVADGVTLTTQVVYGGCDVVNKGAGSSCEIGILQDKLTVSHNIGGHGLEEELTIQGPAARYCDAISTEMTCLNAGADLVAASITVSDEYGNGTGLGVGVGVGIDGGLSEGTFSAGFDVKLGIGFNVSLSFGYEKNGKALYSLGKGAWRKNSDDVIQVAGSAVSKAYNLGVPVVDGLIYITVKQAGSFVTGIANKTADDVISVKDTLSSGFTSTNDFFKRDFLDKLNPVNWW